MRWLLLAAVCALAQGCTSFAPARLEEDQIGDSRAHRESQNTQTLLNIVRMRYGEIPVFLSVTQVISAYQLQHNATGGFELFPHFSADTYASGGIGVQLQQSPTFTFQPLTGEALAQSFVRPLSPRELLPLTLSGVPIDVLFRLAVQSVNRLRNAATLAQVNRSGMPAYYQLLVDLRRLQMAGLLGVRVDDDAAGQAAQSRLEGKLLLTIGDSPDPALEATVAETRHRLGMGRQGPAEVVYGGIADEPGKLSILTRPILGVLSGVAAEIQIPDSDVSRGLALATIDDSKVLHRPAVIIHCSDKRQSETFAEVDYRGRWYWIADNDFDSKLAFSVVQLLITVAETSPAPGTVVTIPAH